jgi:hypothetical protein
VGKEEKNGRLNRAVIVLSLHCGARKRVNANRERLHPTKLSPGVMFAKKNVNAGDALCSEVEGFNLCFGHANENFEQAGIGLLLRERC